MAGGAPIGNQNAAKGREWTEAIRHALLTYETKDVQRKQALNKIAMKVVENALEGQKDAWQEIGNRLDGKPIQPTELSGKDGQPISLSITAQDANVL